MKRIMTILAVMMLWTIPVLAYDGQQTPAPDLNLMVIIFFGLGVIPIVSQLIYNLIQFCSILKGIFAKVIRESVQKVGKSAF